MLPIKLTYLLFILLSFYFYELSIKSDSQTFQMSGNFNTHFYETLPSSIKMRLYFNTIMVYIPLIFLHILLPALNHWSTSQCCCHSDGEENRNLLYMYICSFLFENPIQILVRTTNIRENINDVIWWHMIHGVIFTLWLMERNFYSHKPIIFYTIHIYYPRNMNQLLGIQ